MKSVDQGPKVVVERAHKVNDDAAVLLGAHVPVPVLDGAMLQRFELVRLRAGLVVDELRTPSPRSRVGYGCRRGCRQRRDPVIG